MSVNKNEKLSIPSPLQSIFKNYRFFTHYKPQLMKTTPINEFQPASHLKGLSQKELEAFTQFSRFDFLPPESKSRSRDKQTPVQSTLHSNLYNFQISPTPNLSHYKKTSIDLDHSLKKNVTELLNFSKRLKSTKPYKKIESLLNMPIRPPQFCAVVQKNNRNSSAHFQSQNSLHPIQVNLTVNEKTVNPKTHDTYKLETLVLVKGKNIKMSVDRRLKPGSSLTPDKYHSSTGEFELKSGHRILLSNAPNKTFSISKDILLDAFLKKQKRESIAILSFSNLKNGKPTQKQFGLNQQNRVNKTHDEDLTKKHFYQTDKLIPSTEDFLDLLARQNSFLNPKHQLLNFVSSFDLHQNSISNLKSSNGKVFVLSKDNSISTLAPPHTQLNSLLHFPKSPTCFGVSGRNGLLVSGFENAYLNVYLAAF